MTLKLEVGEFYKSSTDSPLSQQFTFIVKRVMGDNILIVWNADWASQKDIEYTTTPENWLNSYPKSRKLTKLDKALK